MRIEIYKSGFKINWKWRLVDDAGFNIGYGSGFNRKSSVNESLDSITKLIKENGTLYFNVYHSGYIKPSWKWRLTAKNGRILASDKGFLDAEEAYSAIQEFSTYFKNR